jgi:signal transduction histidine kinase
MTPHLTLARTSSVARISGALAAALGLTVTVAWVIGHPTAPSVMPERPPMLPDTALGLVLCGIALWMLAPAPSREPGGRGRLRGGLGRVIAALAVAIAIFAALDFWNALDPSIFERAMRIYTERGGARPERGTPNELAALALAGLAILTLDVRIGRVRVCRVFAGLLLAILLVAFVGLIFGAPALYGRSSTHGMAIPTVLGYSVIAIGVLLSRPHEGTVAVLLARGSGGAVARRLLPVAIVLPLLLGGILLVGEELGWYQRHTATAMLIASAVIVLVIAVTWSAMNLERRDGERSRLLVEAQAARARADEASAAKSRFLATMSHELRTPLNAILGYTELMELGVAGPVSKGQRDYHERVRASGRHLLGLINEVLDFSKLEAGHVTVERTEASVVEALAAAMGLVRPQAVIRGVELREVLECGPGSRYHADPDRVRQILVNLLSNAVKFTADGGRVEAACGLLEGGGPLPSTTRHGWVFIRIRDTGIGIPTEEHDRVFEPFVQMDDGHTRRAGGTGLGLAISRRLARLMDGEITLESRVGQGSTFTLWLPGAATVEATEGSVAMCNVGAALKSNVEVVVESFLDRLRADPALPMAASTSQAALEDHTSALVTDIAQHLVIIDEGRRDATLLIRDGVRLQRRMCELHGAQRWNLGWPEAAIAREFALLRDAIDECLRSKTSADVRQQVDDALQVLHVFVDAAASSSRDGWRRASRRGLRAIS